MTLTTATNAFAGTAAVKAALAYGVIEIGGVLVLALLWRRGTPAALDGRRTVP